MCYALLPITDWGALARHMREEHLRLPVKRWTPNYSNFRTRHWR
jgi:hypothetical protein